MEQESHQTEEFQSPNTITTPCANNCGFFGSSATNNLCSKCYRDHFLTKSKASIDSVAAATASVAAEAETLITVDAALVVEEKAEVDVQAGDTSVKKPANRCGACNKRVGLMGFKCRCGEVLCSVHRYSDKHGCLFDYKGAAQDAIAKANPVVKPDKVDKI